MSRARIRPLGVVLLVSGCLGLSGFGVGCNKATSGARPSQTFVSPEWPKLNIQTLAYLGIGSSIGDEPTRERAEQLVGGELRGNQTRFVILSEKTCRSRAEQAGQLELYDKVRKVWRDVRKVDQFLAKDLCDALKVDGLIFGDLTDWREERIDWTQEGTSWTQVALGLYIYSRETGLLVWGADRVERKDSIPYRPARSSTGYTDSEQTQRAEARGETKTPDPPPADDVARQVLSELMAEFPPRS
jgi:hypothetical protein